MTSDVHVADHGANPAADIISLARDAWERGKQALLTGDRAAAIRWLDRACRLAPRDGTIALTLAGACLSHDSARARQLFQAIAESADVREAWLGLVAAYVQLNDIGAAAAALGTVLARHALDARFAAAPNTLADAIVHLTGGPGWCGLASDGRLVFRAAANRVPEILLDERVAAIPHLSLVGDDTHRVSVLAGGQHFLGSPIDVATIRRIVGFVEADDGGLRGWAYQPGNPDSDPTLLISSHGDGGDRVSRIVARDTIAVGESAPPLARPRGFSVAAAALRGWYGPISVRGRDGSDLHGSPINPVAEQLAATTAKPPALAARNRRTQRSGAAYQRTAQRRVPATVLVPLYPGSKFAVPDLERLVAAVPPPDRVAIVLDATLDAALHAAIRELTASGQLDLLDHDHRLGTASAINAAFAANQGRDLAVLNPAALLPPGWLRRLRTAAYSAADIGSVTPLSNNAGILGYPAPDRSSSVQPDSDQALRLDALTLQANRSAIVEIPFGTGGCIYLRRACIDAVGLVRADLFPEGHAALTDFALRARQQGWRHVAVPGLYVADPSTEPHDQAARDLHSRNERLLNRLHPGYRQGYADFRRTDPLAEPRRKIDLRRWRESRQSAGRSVILLTHDEGGGVARQVSARAEALRQSGRSVVLLRPGRNGIGQPQIIVSDAATDDFPNLRFDLPTELSELLQLLRATRPSLLEVHHLLGYPPVVHDLIKQLNVPYEVHIHDYFWFCQRVSLVGPGRHYCGEPSPAGCESCLALAGRIVAEDISVAALIDRSTAFLGNAERVLVPSHDAALRMRRHFPDLRPIVLPHEDELSIADPPYPTPREGKCRICVVGAIGLHKGYDVLLGCARDAAERHLPIEFIVVGHTIDDATLLAIDNVFVTGEFKPEEAIPLLRRQDASLALLPSIWPETWSFALTELWSAGLRVAAFDIGAPAERIRRTGRGFLLPLDLSPTGVNNALLAAVGLTRQKAP